MGLILFIVIVDYILLAIFALNKIYEKTEKKLYRNLVLALFILTPTWDIVIGYPIYKYLCYTDAGVHVYKTVENVEGFYVGEKTEQFKQIFPYIMPYEGYKYIDYKGRHTKSYLRTSWIDSNTSYECIKPNMQVSLKHNKYLQEYNKGRCLVTKEISEKEVSRWEYDLNYNSLEEVSQWEYDLSYDYAEKIIPIVRINKKTAQIKDRKNNQVIAQNIGYSLDQNWLLKISRIAVKKSWANSQSKRDMLKETLKTKV
jgi:ribosomal protein L20